VMCEYRSCHRLKTDTAQWTKTKNEVYERRWTGWRSMQPPACSITDTSTSSVVITGGFLKTPEKFLKNPTSRVTRYDETGWVEHLPSLLTARYNHGCALYATDTGDKVYVVMGGYDGDDYLSSTETLQLGEDAWRESTALPRPLAGLRAATLDNIIYITGGYEGYTVGKIHDEIYQLDTEIWDWVEVARMKNPRYRHALSVIKYSEVEGLCTEE